MIDIEKLKSRCGYKGKSQQWQYGFDLAIRELSEIQSKLDYEKEREQFESKFPKAHFIEWNERANRYCCPYVASTAADTYSMMHKVWIERAKMQVLPVGFKAVPEELDDATAAKMAEAEFKHNEFFFMLEFRNSSEAEKQEFKSRWLRQKAKDIQKAYKHFVGYASGLGVTA
ncbi:hypothetical protein [Acinetobacter baumannii]|uniref:hypothetical protein n=1 Tax=Acinetobacter baumannii TaxID=470 RepID=UPI000994291E|nr:hypothetical protein [Acinetobacter baumannii]MBR8589776.1 hypothetical protein [Acinetobacter baumannii]MBR9724576.1 hypothetical protein [Acinetobacter baumannii]OOS42758.1 hypothetical protein BTG57_00350 [Acinetobacter baumannii]OVM88665.1 hypothetical protein B4S22_11425 [Acinetobacter baumannii]OVN17205.1 hypothetical protein B4S24_12320 [Acinetobacter baumannii]